MGSHYPKVQIAEAIICIAADILELYKAEYGTDISKWDLTTTTLYLLNSDFAIEDFLQKNHIPYNEEIALLGITRGITIIRTKIEDYFVETYGEMGIDVRKDMYDSIALSVFNLISNGFNSGENFI